MPDLARKYRPRKLSDIYGQAAAVSALETHLASGTNQSVLLVGPSGTGKTTAARILGATFVCRKPQRPCGWCEDCDRIFSEIRGSIGWIEIDGARFSNKSQFDAAADALDGRTVWPTTVFVDEVHAIDNAAADYLLKLVEQPVKTAQFIAATTDLPAVRPALRKRCKVINFQPLAGSQAFALLSKVCGLEAIAFEPKALDMIATAARGSAREALIMLDQVALQGDVTCDLVATTLAFGSVAPLVRLFDALIDRDANRQEAALYEWQAEPLRKAELIRDYLLYVFFSEVATQRIDQIVDPAFHTVTGEERSRLVRAMKARAGSRSLPDYWLDLLDAWQFDPAKMAAPANVRIAVLRLDRMMNGPGSAAPGEVEDLLAVLPSAEASRQRAYRSRSAKLLTTTAAAAGAGAGRYLSLKQAEAIYDAASFLPMNTGLLLNARLALNHGLLGRDSEQDVATLVSDLTHELGMRVKSWTGADELHWLYVHERRDGGLVTEIVAHVPAAAMPMVPAWLAQRLGDWRNGAVEPGTWLLDLPNAEREAGWPRNRVKRHWRLVRRLWRGVDPQIGHAAGSGMKQPLVDLLEVPGSWRGSLGKLDELRRLGGSHSVGPTARNRAASRKMKLLSAFRDAAWDSIDAGWELAERGARQRELGKRCEAEERERAEWPGANPIEVENRRVALMKLEASWPDDPRLWPRSWPVWWPPTS